MRGTLPAALLTCLAAHSAAGESPARQWYTLSIDGQRVGYGWHELRTSSGVQIDAQVLRVYVAQLRHVSVVETTTEIERDAQGRPKSIRVAQTYDVMARLVVTPPYRVPASAREGPIRYVLSRSDGAASAIPATGEQDVVMDGDKAVLTICRTCGKAARLTDAERRAYLAPNRWVQSDAPEVRDFARLNAGRGAPAEVMAQLVEAIRKHMSGGVDHLGYASATQALESRAGDCTEFSVLLAAGARHTDIAARWW